ncbi:5-formyltetrahydrofolate cyclo-ligase [Sporosarcina aquimarina]|uniref:5-formyltetrahydrofolate cyclo-ligase n=1 Tax=Sporosarcina aquimarina TaxID=114975 RepID=A0ABU4FW52_9BACL|nr:5-formyltetrahydrofolate cyclo-ligase [Sporosarcina aquimarina]MDW0108946.1 5-formyltetrahydrofolate cyclo-ligase [Sporosarcina aquimarina]
MDKKIIRNTILLNLKNMTENEYKDYSIKIKESLLETAEFIEAETIAITLSRNTEVETRSIIKNCWSKGKTVVVPKCYPHEREMDFREITDFNQLETVYAGLQEPNPDLTTAFDKEDIDLIIVPGVAFTNSGFRIGYGGGYYDRFLADYTGKTISLAFELQMVPSLPIERHDLPVGKIITEERVVLCSELA